MRWLERIAWVAVGVSAGAWIYPISEFISQAVLGHSPLNPKEIQ